LVGWRRGVKGKAVEFAGASYFCEGPALASGAARIITPNSSPNAVAAARRTKERRVCTGILFMDFASHRLCSMGDGSGARPSLACTVPLAAPSAQVTLSRRRTKNLRAVRLLLGIGSCTVR